jgi:hypothetical protein
MWIFRIQTFKFSPLINFFLNSQFSIIPPKNWIGQILAIKKNLTKSSNFRTK